MSGTALWVLGWAIGALVVALVAALLVWIIGLARRVARQAAGIAGTLDGAAANTEALYDVASVNLAIDRIERGLRAVRTGATSR